MNPSIKQQTPSFQSRCESSNSGSQISRLKKENSDINAQDCDGISPLHIAVQNKDYWSIRKLIQKEAKIDLLNENGHNAAWIACFETLDMQAALFLFKSGSDPFIKDETGKTLLGLLKQSNNPLHKKMLKFLKGKSGIAKFAGL